MAEKRTVRDIHIESIRCLNEISAWERCCVITVINHTRYNLTCGKAAMISGTLHRAVPAAIVRDDYGIICSRKVSYSVKGVIGMVSYEIQGLDSDNRFLQIGWQVPLAIASYELYCIVDLGQKKASTTRANKLLYQTPPEKRRRAAECNPGIFEIGNFRFEVAMSDARQSVLTVQISEVVNTESEPKLTGSNDFRRER